MEVSIAHRVVGTYFSIHTIALVYKDTSKTKIPI